MINRQIVHDKFINPLWIKVHLHPKMIAACSAYIPYNANASSAFLQNTWFSNLVEDSIWMHPAKQAVRRESSWG